MRPTDSLWTGYCKFSARDPEYEYKSLCDISTGLDKGGADLVVDGKIKVKNGHSLRKFTENGVVLSDGSELSADLVIFA